MKAVVIETRTQSSFVEGLQFSTVVLHITGTKDELGLLPTVLPLFVITDVEDGAIVSFRSTNDEETQAVIDKIGNLVVPTATPAFSKSSPKFPPQDKKPEVKEVAPEVK